MFGLGPMEITLIIVALLLLFGTRLPKIALGLGKSIVNFKQGIREIDVVEDVKKVL